MSQLLFLDTNVFLSFFHFSKDDLEALRQLAVLVRAKKVTLLVPEQVANEFERNRDGNVAKALKEVEASKLPNQYPRLFQGFPEYKELRAAVDAFERARKSILVKVRSAAQQRKLGADRATQQLFKVATQLETTADLFTAADRRHRLGDPPGKRDQDSLGDAVIWEAMLVSSFAGDLFFVSEDGDWASPLDPSAFNSYLQDEWASAKKGAVRFYQRLSGFLNENYPDIKLSTELEKDLQIAQLASSRSFAQTHAAIAALREFSDFTDAQINAIVAAYINNNQIRAIVDDRDVRDFLMDNVIDRVPDLDPQLVPKLLDLLDETAMDSPLRYLRMEVGLTWYGPGGEIPDSSPSC
jgi:hypothetical protein